MVKAIIGAIAAFMTALVLALCKAAGKASRLEEEKELEEQKNEILRKQMETVNEVRKELKLVEKEPEPEVVEAPPAGDSSSRLDRLNRLHDSSKGSGNSCT
jgi:dihydrodipicolinate synthase/N-acetylneuraminate lyase